jgi:hypothetical protein
MKDVHATGVTNTKAEKEPVTDEEEEQMWQAEVLGDKDFAIYSLFLQWKTIWYALSRVSPITA